MGVNGREGRALLLIRVSKWFSLPTLGFTSAPQKDASLNPLHIRRRIIYANMKRFSRTVHVFLCGDSTGKPSRIDTTRGPGLIDVAMPTLS